MSFYCHCSVCDKKRKNTDMYAMVGALNPDDISEGANVVCSAKCLNIFLSRVDRNQMILLNPTKGGKNG